MLRLFLIVVLLALACVESRAQYIPSWWLDSVNPVIDPGPQTQNLAVANVAQLKWIATRAKAHLDATLGGGAGSAINTMVAGFSLTGNLKPANLGQLKAVAKPFYDRLLVVGYNTNLNLKANGYPPNWTDNYPWNSVAPVPVAENYKPVTLGQLKLVFSFDIVDADGNGTLDYQEGIYPAASSSRDTDGDGVPDATDAYPNDPSKTSSLVNDPNDHSSPSIAIVQPVGVTLIP